MKNLILILSIALSLSATAQTALPFKTAQKCDLRQVADSIALNAKRVYTYEKEGTPKDNENYYIIQYTNALNAEDNMRVFFRIEAIGASDALEQNGTEEYKFYGVTGKYLDLFTFWHKFINPSAVKEKVAENLQDIVTVNGLRFTLKEDSGANWKIEAR